MPKYYFSKQEQERCYTLDYWKQYLIDNGLNEIELYEAVRDTGSGHFYCKEFCEVGISGEGCGKECDKYTPNNGKNGRCKHFGYCYEITDNKFTLKRYES